MNPIVINYLKTYFIFDLLGTVPAMVMQEKLYWYAFKFFRFVHVYRIHKPFSYLLKRMLAKYSKKRQNDLITFMILILAVIYTSHLKACIWLYLGNSTPCIDEKD